MNYSELFNVFYSNLPESVKISILDKIPSDIIIEDLNESSSEIGTYVELLDTLAYSSVSEATVEGIIDEVFSGLSADVTEEILEAYVREKAVQYIEEAIAHGTDAIGLAGMKRERAEREAKAQKVQARREAINNAVGNTVTRARELKDRAVTGARQTAERIGQKANDIRNTMANKAGEVKNKAVSGIKNAVGKVRDYVKKATEPSAKDYVNAIGKKALENEKTELKVKPGSYADRYAKAMKKHEETYGKLNKPKKEVKAETPKVEVAKAKAEKAKKPKKEVKAENSKVEVAKAKAEKAKKEVKAETPKVETKKEEKPKKEVAKAKAEKVKKPKKEVKAENPKVETKKEEKPKVEVAKAEEVKKEKEVKAETPKVETKKEESTEKSSKSPIKVKNVYKAHGDLKPSEEAKIKAESKKEKEVKAETPKVEAKKEEISKAETPKVEAKKEDAVDKLINSPSGAKRTREQMEKIYDVKNRNKEQQDIKRLKDDIKMLGIEIDGAEGKPSMASVRQEKMKKRDELRKKLQELQSTQTNEAISNLACLLVKTNISESCFVEVMKITNPINNRKLKFQEIASKLTN